MLNEDHQLIRKTAAQFADDRLAPYALEWEKQAFIPKNIFSDLGQLGFMSMLVSEGYGGSDVGYVAYSLAMEEIARGDASCSTIMGVHNSVACLPLEKYGSEKQKKKYLPRMVTGENIGAFCLTEPGAGSDASQLKCKAEKKGDSYVINGTKQFITSGKTASIALVFAVTNPELGKKGISAFIIPTDTPGYKVSQIENKLGQKASDTCQIILEDCIISKDNLLGQEGEGYKIALSNLESGRIGIAAQSVGIAQAAFDAALKYSKEREAFGHPIFNHQSIAFSLSEMTTDIEAARLLYIQAAQLKDGNKPCLKQACMAKLFASQMAEKVCSKAIQIYGGYGYVEDCHVERFYRDVRVCQIYEGTNEVQKMVIAKQL